MSVCNSSQLSKPESYDPYEFTDDTDDDASATSTQSVASSLNSELNGLISSPCSVPTSSNANVPFSKKSSSKCEPTQSELDFEFLVGEKSNSKLLSTLCDHQIYGRHGSCVRGHRYRCRARPCRAFVIFDPKENKCIKLSNSPPHKHLKDTVESDYWDLVALNEMRALCTNLAALAGPRKMTSVSSIFYSVKPK